MSVFGKPWLQRLLALALGGIFIYASLDKIAHPPDFARIVYHYHLIGPNQWIPPLLPNIFAVVLPWVEAVVGLALIVGFWRREAAFVTALMLVAFLGAVGSAMARGIDIEKCGCFSVSAGGRRAGALLIAEDVAMLAAALLLVKKFDGPESRA